MPETPVTSVARRVPHLRVRSLPGNDRPAVVPAQQQADKNVCPPIALALRSDIPSLEYWLDINA